MRVPTCFKCLHGKEEQKSEPWNRGRPRYCAKEACWRASKTASQRPWLSRPENAGYTSRGSGASERVKRWKEAPWKYWQRGKRCGGGDASQESGAEQSADGKKVAALSVLPALQEICFPQPSLFERPMSVLTDQWSQEDIDKGMR